MAKKIPNTVNVVLSIQNDLLRIDGEHPAPYSQEKTITKFDAN